MNERIKLLAEQARVNVITTKGMEGIVDGCYIISPDKLEQFAELIVRECMSITDKCSTGPGLHDLFADKIIAEHFGVEE